MERKKASEFDPGLMKLFDSYVHGGISRREFLDGASKFAVGGLTAAGLVESLSPHYAWAEQVPKNDPRLKTEYITFDSPKGQGKIKAYLVRPAESSGKLPGVLVIHENRGLNPYIEDVARRVGLLGYVALAPDELTPLGGYPGDDDKGREMQAKLDPDKMTEDFAAAAGWLKASPLCDGKVGVVGFCFGGTMTNRLAVRIPDLAAAVPFYGMQPPAADVAKIKAPLLIHYAEKDERVDAGWPAFEEALKANHVRYTEYMYEGAYHGFHNDTTPRYDEKNAKLAWERTVEFFAKYLK